VYGRVIFLQTCPCVAIVDGRYFTGLQRLDSAQNAIIEVLLDYRMCFGVALLDELEVELFTSTIV